MSRPPLELGAVFQMEWSENPVRVIAFDADVVMYDTWWPRKSGWAMGKLTGTFTYYRVPRELFVGKARYVRVDEYTPQQAAVHRPDLPFSIAQCESMSWYEERPETDATGSRSML